LTYIHNAFFSGIGQVRINDIAGPDVIVELNLGGTLAPDMQIRLEHTPAGVDVGGRFLLVTRVTPTPCSHPAVTPPHAVSAPPRGLSA
jgi:hypothetical protein